MTPVANSSSLSTIDYDVNAQDREGKTALHNACNRNDHTEVQSLLNQGASPFITDKNGFSPLGLSIYLQCDCIQLLLSKCPNSINDSFYKDHLLMPFFLCVKQGSEDALEKMIALCKSFCNIRDKEGKTALHHATEVANGNRITMLVQSGFDVNALDFHGRSPLTIACKEKNHELIRLLRATHKADLYVGIPNPARIAWMYDDHKTLSLLIELGLDPLQRLDDGTDLSEIATVEPKLAETLSQASTITKKKETALPQKATWFSAVAKMFSRESYLAPVTDDPDGNFRIHLLAASTEEIAPDHLKTIDLTAWSKLNGKGETPLGYMARRGTKKSMQNVSRALNPKLLCTVDNNQNSLLHIALIHQNSDIALAILTNTSLSPLKDAKNNNKQTPLHIACAHAMATIVKRLLGLDVDPNAQDKDGNTPLHALTLASKQNEATLTIPLLLEKGAQANLPNVKKITALHSAVEHGKSHLVLELLKHKANVEAKNLYDETPLMVAAQKGNAEIAKILMEHGAERRAINSQTSALISACTYPSPEIASLLLQKKNKLIKSKPAKVNEGFLQATPLSATIYKCPPSTKSDDTAFHAPSIILLKQLLKAKADPNRQVIDLGSLTSPLQIAIKVHSFHAVQLLLNAKATVDDETIKRAQEIAKQTENKDIITLLQEQQNHSEGSVRRTLARSLSNLSLGTSSKSNSQSNSTSSSRAGSRQNSITNLKQFFNPSSAQGAD